MSITIDNGSEENVFIDKESSVSQIKTARDDTLSYKVQAEASATNASVSEANAEASANTASTKATEASQYSSNANTSATNANTYKVQAEGFKDQATTQANISTTQATIATNKANEAEGYATTSSEAKDIAVTQAGIATTKATEAVTARNESVSAKNSSQADRDAISQLKEHFDSKYGIYSNATAPDPQTKNEGELYWNTDDDTLYVRRNGLWAIAIPQLTDVYTISEIDALLSANELADRDRANHTGTQDLDTITETPFKKIMTNLERAKLNGIEDNATQDQTGAEIKALYEAEDDTNAYTDADKAKVEYLTATQPIDLDAQLELSEVIKDKFRDTNEPTGFIREFPATMGILELCTDGTKVIHKDGFGNITITNDGLWSDGTGANARTFRLSPYDGNDVEIYIEGTKFKFNTAQEILLDNTTGLKFIYLDIDGTLKVDSTFSFDYFEDRPIVSTVYGNAITQELVNFGDERHGIQMDGETHRYLHFTQGTQYVSGMEIQGLTNGGTTYTQITSGKAYDEDIYMEPAQQTNSPHLYRIGQDWYIENDSNLIAKIDGSSQYNPTDGTDYSLASVTGNDTMIVFFCLTNNIEFPYVKVLGQRVYNNTSAARSDIDKAISDLVLDGLPSPEFLPIGAVIVDSDGELKTLSDGSLYYDLRGNKVAGGGSNSGTAVYHQDLLGRDTSSSHPATAISYDNSGSGLIATTVQTAIDELNGNIVYEW
jgi:hypothetical protein